MRADMHMGLVKVGGADALLALVVGSAPARAAAPARGGAVARTWSVSLQGTHLQIAYGSGRYFPQYADLDKGSGYFRMINSVTAGWGTSVISPPALWTKTSCPADYCQGAPVRASWHRSGPDLVLSVHGIIATLKVAVTVTLMPPARGTLAAKVSEQGHRDGQA